MAMQARPAAQPPSTASLNENVDSSALEAASEQEQDTTETPHPRYQELLNLATELGFCLVPMGKHRTRHANMERGAGERRRRDVA